MSKSTTVLVVENDEFDQICFQRAWEEMRHTNPLAYASDGLEALKMLRGTDDCQKIEKPCIIILDLDMPKMDGLTFLAELRKDPGLKDLQVFIYTTAITDSQIKQADKLGATGFILKSDIKGCLNEILDEMPIARQLVA